MLAAGLWLCISQKLAGHVTSACIFDLQLLIHEAFHEGQLVLRHLIHLLRDLVPKELRLIISQCSIQRDDPHTYMIPT